MRTIKPLTLTVLNAPFQHDGKVRLVLVVGVMVSLDGTAIEQEQSIWKSLSVLPGSNGSLDEVRPKVRGEALVAGYVHAPRGKSVPIVAARLAVGPIDKEIWAVGDREWRATGPTDAIPFQEMPLGYDRAFGGEGYAPNPIGKGYAPIKSPSGHAVHPLPNLELAKKLVTSPRDRPVHAGFGPIDPSWPQRIKKGGTYDKAWLDTKYPEMPDDFDPTYFNVAPEDQWIDGYWEGGEAFVLENMHPERPRIEGTVPSLTARCFVTRRGGEGAFDEVGLRCDTLWFLPHLDRVILLFRGGIDVEDEEAADVTDVLVALERKGEARPVEHYRDVRARRLDKDQGALHTLRDSELIPPGITPVRSAVLSEMDALLAREDLFTKNARRRAQRELDRAREQLRAAGIDPDKHFPKELPVPQEVPTELEKLPDVIAGAREQAAEAMRQADEHREAAMARARAVCKQAGIDFDAKVAEAQRSAGGPPKFRAADQIARVRSLLEQARVVDAKVPPQAAMYDDPAFLAKLEQADTAMRDAYRKFAQYLPPARSLGEPDAARLRSEVEAALASGASFAERDLTGADLAGLDFSGRDLSGAFLEKTNLAGCSFRGANVEHAVFVRANLAGADFHGARAKGANFGEADLTGAKLTGGVDLSESIFIRASLKEANFTGATLDKAQLSEVRCEKTIFAGIRARGLLLLKGDLRGLDLRGAQLAECNLLDVDLSGADLTDASLFRTLFLDTNAEGACFRGAKLERFRVVKAEKGSSLARCDLRGANLQASNLRGVNLAGADFRDADLSRSDLSGCDARGANFEGARAVEVRLIKTDLTDANLARADLMHALMGAAVVRGASFEEASVFRADAAKMKGDDRTSFKGANVKGVRVVPDRSGHG